jgi:hypothetical protein
MKFATLTGISSGRGKRRSFRNTFHRTKMPSRCEALRAEFTAKRISSSVGGEITLQFGWCDRLIKLRIRRAFNR